MKEVESGKSQREAARWKVVERKDERGKKSPRCPINALKAAATTTVGSMKGTAVNARRMDLPRKSKREKRIAEGMPRAKVKIVERVAW